MDRAMSRSYPKPARKDLARREAARDAEKRRQEQQAESIWRARHLWDVMI